MVNLFPTRNAKHNWYLPGEYCFCNTRSDFGVFGDYDICCYLVLFPQYNGPSDEIYGHIRQF